jgi:hypothetical protein
MADQKKPPQKTALLTDAPPEVQAAIDRQKGGGQPAPSGQATQMLEAPQVQAPQPAAGGGQPVVPTMMRQKPSGSLPPVKRKKQSTVGRWIAGPLISVGVAAGTAALAGVVMPPKPKVVAPPPKVMGKLMLSTNPPGASVTIDGQPFPHFTPTEVEREVGTTLKIGFKLDGYQSKEEEVLVASGERPFSVKLDKAEPVAPPPAPAAPVAAAPAAPAPKDKHEHHAAAPKTKEPAGKGTLSVFVRPWAIVYVDGNRLRQTPVQAYELPAGKHKIELVNDPKGKKEKLEITIEPNQSQEIRKDWDK